MAQVKKHTTKTYLTSHLKDCCLCKVYINIWRCIFRRDDGRGQKGSRSRFLRVCTHAILSEAFSMFHVHSTRFPEVVIINQSRFRPQGLCYLRSKLQPALGNHTRGLYKSWKTRLSARTFASVYNPRILVGFGSLGHSNKVVLPLLHDPGPRTKDEDAVGLSPERRCPDTAGNAGDN